MPRRPVGILWCPNDGGAGRKNKDGWSFPRVIESKIVELTAGGSVCHFFGGKAKFGFRLDCDLLTNPDVVGDAWLPPFRSGSFDSVVLDPPYFMMSREILFSLLYAASWTARQQVIWLHTIWSPSGAGLRLDQSWLVRCGDSRVVRCLQVFRKNGKIITPMRRFSRGPMMKYNRWLVQPRSLPFGEAL